jgi:hypothetical protein
MVVGTRNVSFLCNDRVVIINVVWRMLVNMFEVAQRCYNLSKELEGAGQRRGSQSISV